MAEPRDVLGGHQEHRHLAERRARRWQACSAKPPCRRRVDHPVIWAWLMPHAGSRNDRMQTTVPPRPVVSAGRRLSQEPAVALDHAAEREVLHVADQRGQRRFQFSLNCLFHADPPQNPNPVGPLSVACQLHPAAYLADRACRCCAGCPHVSPIISAKRSLPTGMPSCRALRISFTASASSSGRKSVR